VTYQGGGVIATPKVYVVFWGNWTRSGGDPKDEQDYLINFLKAVGATNWLDIVLQYGGGSPANLYGGEWNDTSAVPNDPLHPSNGPDQAQVEGEVMTAANHFGFGGGLSNYNNIVLVATPHGYGYYGFGGTNGTCGYHDYEPGSSSSPHVVPYIDLPYSSDVSDCGIGSQNFNSQVTDDLAGVNDGVSIVGGHELAETLTDPFVGGSGWYGPGGEIGDKCQWFNLGNVTMGRGGVVGTDVFAIQPLWSNAANACVRIYDHWSSWTSELGGPPPGGFVGGGAAPAVSSWAADRLDVFAIDSNSAVEHRSWSGNGWSGWESLGGTLFGSPAAVSWGPNRIDLFGIGTDGNVWHKWWGGSSWSGWASEIGAPPPGIAGSPAVSSWGSGRLDVFVVGKDGAVWHDWYDGSWHSWESLGGDIVSDVTAVSWGPNRIDLFGIGTDGNIWHKWWGGSSWSGWASEIGAPPPGVGTAPAVSSWGPGRLDIFVVDGNDVVGSGSTVWHDWYDGSWHSWQSVGGTVGSKPAAVSWLPYRIDVVGTGPDSLLTHLHYG